MLEFAQRCDNVCKLADLLWPRPAFADVPGARLAAKTASELRSRLAPQLGPLDLDLCSRLARVEVDETYLGAAAGGRQGLLLPAERDMFRIFIDPVPRGGWGSGTDHQHRQTARRRARFLLAHELAHTLFYRRDGEVPRRALPAGSVEEEDYCDAFARHLLVPCPAGVPNAADVVACQRRYDVSLELAARASASEDAAVVLWRWDPPAARRRPPLHIQWASDASLSVRSEIFPYRTDPVDLPELFAAQQRRLGTRFSAAWLPKRRQALAVFG